MPDSSNSLSWIDLIAEKMAEHDARVQQRERAISFRQKVREAERIHRERSAEARRLAREARNKPCGAMTRAGHPCRRKGLGKGGRCSNHGGMSTGPRTEEGRQRLREAVRARWARQRAERVAIA